MFERNASGEFRPSRAIIDIGSNTVRLVVYGGPPRAPVVLLNEKVTAKLGKCVASSGRLADKARQSALAALTRYHAILGLLEVPSVEVVATAAARDAEDGAEFLEQVRAIGLAPRLLSGEEEAVTSAMGVLGAFPGARGVVADLGGGSLELTDVEANSCSHGVSMPLGSLHLPLLRADGERAFVRTVEKAFAGTDWAAIPGSPLYLVGGTFRAFARYAMHQHGWLSDDPHGYRISTADASRLVRSLSRKTADDLSSIPGVSSSRLPSLPDAAALLSVLLKTLSPSELVCSSWGLREGLLFKAMHPVQQQQDPLIAGVSAFVERRGVSAATAAMLVGWCSPAHFSYADSCDERLRLVMTMLAQASGVVEPNRRADLAVDWALRKRWIGVDAHERVLIAAMLLANAGRLELPGNWAAFASSEDLHDAQGWGLAVRLCRRFSACAAQSLSNSALRVEKGTLKLLVRQPFAALVNEGIERDLKALAMHLDLKPEWRTVEDGEALR